MIRASGLSRLIVTLLPVTLCWKLLPNGSNSYELTNEMTGFLSRQGYHVTQQTVISDMPFIHAESGDCRIVMVALSPEGWSRDIFAETAKSMDRKFVVFDGSVYRDQPVWLTTTSDRWTGLLRRMGFRRPQKHATAVAETNTCEAERLPWNEFLREPAK